MTLMLPVRLPNVEDVAEQIHENWRLRKEAAGVTTRKCAEDGSELMLPWSELTETARALYRVLVEDVYDALMVIA